MKKIVVNSPIEGAACVFLLHHCPKGREMEKIRADGRWSDLLAELPISTENFFAMNNYLLKPRRQPWIGQSDEVRTYQSIDIAVHQQFINRLHDGSIIGSLYDRYEANSKEYFMAWDFGFIEILCKKPLSLSVTHSRNGRFTDVKMVFEDGWEIKENFINYR